METKVLSFKTTPTLEKVNMRAALDYIIEYNECRYDGAKFYDNAVTGIGNEVPKLKIPDSVDAWDIIENIIEQHYAREKQMMDILMEARSAKAKIDRSEERNKKLNQEIERLYEIIYKDEKLNQSPLPVKIADSRTPVLDQFEENQSFDDMSDELRSAIECVISWGIEAEDQVISSDGFRTLATLRKLESFFRELENASN